MTPEIIAIIASGLSALAARMAVGDRSGPVLIAFDLSPALATALAGSIRVARDVSQAAVERAAYRKPLPAGLGETAALLCEANAQALRHMAVAVSAQQYQDRLQLSEAATIMHNIHCQFAGPLRALVTYSSLDEVYGATLSSNAMGGRPLSTLRGQNAFQHLVESADGAPISITTGAAMAAQALIASDPVLLPLGVEAVASHLSEIASGARLTA